MIPAGNGCRDGVGTVNNGLSATRGRRRDMVAERTMHEGRTPVGSAVLLGLLVLTGVAEGSRA